MHGIYIYSLKIRLIYPKLIVRCRAKKSTEERRAYEQALREKLSKRRLIGKTLLVIDKYAEVEESEPEILPFTDNQHHRYNELVQGPAHVVRNKEMILLSFTNS